MEKSIVICSDWKWKLHKRRRICLGKNVGKWCEMPEKLFKVLYTK